MDALHDFLHRRHRTADDMHLDIEAHAAHAERFLDAVLAVDAELLLEDMQDLLVARQADRAGGFDHPVDVGGRDFLLLDFHHTARIDAADMAAGDAGMHLVDLAIGHQLGLLQRALDCAHRGFDVDHHALLHAVGFVHAHADHLQHAVRLDLADDGHDLGGADIQPDHQVFGFLVSAHFLYLTAYPSTFDHAAHRKPVAVAHIHIAHRTCLRRQAVRVYRHEPLQTLLHLFSPQFQHQVVAQAQLPGMARCQGEPRNQIGRA